MNFPNLSTAVRAAMQAGRRVSYWSFGEDALLAAPPVGCAFAVITLCARGLSVRYAPPPRPLRPVLPVGAALN